MSPREADLEDAIRRSFSKESGDPYDDIIDDDEDTDVDEEDDEDELDELDF